MPKRQVSNNEEIMRMLLERRADVNQKTALGTALMAAGRNCRLPAMEFLLSNNVSNASVGSSKCEDLPLPWIVSHRSKGSVLCQGEQSIGGKLAAVVELLQRHNASFDTGGKDCRGGGQAEASKGEGGPRACNSVNAKHWSRLQVLPGREPRKTMTSQP